MSSMHNTVHYCCVAKGNRTLYVYSGADIEIENVAALCLERPPSYHKWYFETIGKPNKQDKRKSKDHAITIRDIELEEHRKSTDRGAKLDSTTLDSNNQADLGSMRIRASSQSIRKKWWRQVRIVLAIDVAVCLILFVIWLSICGGFGCTH
ncbi:hypothetical protein NC652_031475 [Populus alba x Populus x berolinensis]|nr:hypothetical protein NC652_031475 [Populus alba x Populus x berolinensis]